MSEVPTIATPPIRMRVDITVNPRFRGWTLSGLKQWRTDIWRSFHLPSTIRDRSSIMGIKGLQHDKDNGAIIDLTLKFPLNAPQLKFYFTTKRLHEQYRVSSGQYRWIYCPLVPEGSIKFSVLPAGMKNAILAQT